MKRRDFLKFAGASAGVLALSSCSAAGWGIRGGGGKTVELTYALWDTHEQIGYQASVNEFMRRNPDIKVQIEQIPYGNYQQKITAQYISGNAPDVFWVNTPWLGDWARGGVLIDIASRVKKAKIDMSQYIPSLVKLHQDGSKMYGLPKDWDTIAFFYNATHFAKCGFTSAPTNLSWNPTDGGSFLHFLKQITLDSKGHNALDSNFDPGSVATYAMISANDFQGTWGNYFAMNGGGALAKPYATTSILNSKANQETMGFLTTMLNNAHVALPAGESGPDGNGANAETLLASGRVATWQTGDWNTLGVSQLSGFKIGIMPMPAGPQGRVSVINGLIDGIPTNTKHPEEAWRLMQWLGSSESQQILGRGGYIWPAIQSLDPLFLAYWKGKGLNMQTFLDASKGKTVNFPVATGMQEALTDVTTALGPAFLGQQSPATALASATEVFDYRIGYATAG